MSLREHLSELKRRFKIAFMSFVIILVTFLIVPSDPTTFLSQGYNGFTPVIAFFISRVKLDLLPPNWQFIVVSINEPLEIYIVASVLFAFIFNSPIFAYEVIKFISPGLNEKEKRLIYPFVGSTAGLFTFGSFFGYFFLAKFLLAALTPFFLSPGVSPPRIDAANFYFIVFLTIGMSGVAFTVPVYIYTLIRFGVIQAATFTKNRIIVWAVTYILCAIITPDGGPFLDVLLFLPIISLLELAVFIGGRSRRSIMAKREQEEGYSGTVAPAAPGPSPPPAPAPALPPTVAVPSVSAPGPAPAVVTPASAPVTGPHCPYCSFPVGPGTVFCPNCGKAIQ
jgi:sec-independent protein translocase protein TatC